MACLLSDILGKKILTDFYAGDEVYPLKLKAISPILLDDLIPVLRLYFPSGFPITIEFVNGNDDIDQLIVQLQSLKSLIPGGETH